MSFDVTFHESESFFLAPQLSLQGESPRCVEEISELPMMIEVEHPVMVDKEKIEIGEERAVESEEREPETERVERPKEKELLVYSRGTWNKRNVNDILETTAASQLPLPFPLSDEDSGTSDTDTSSFSPINDLDVPIAVRKGVRSCTQHPISNFVSYSHLSPSYKAFLSKISSIPVPNHVQDALADPKWKPAMIE